jgi:hypothetical protein
VAKAQCGVCGSKKGKFVEGDSAIVFDRHGRKHAACFNFKCSQKECGALCGTFTCALSPHGQELRHVISNFALEATIFLPLRKPHQRLDEYTGFGRCLLEDMTNNAATHKSFEAFTLCYNRAMEFGCTNYSTKPHKQLNANVFRNAWFLANYFIKSMEMGLPPNCVLNFTKREIGGHGSFEWALEEINGALSDQFTQRWVNHEEGCCGIKHQVLVGDGQVKTHFDTCDGKNGAVIVDATLGRVQLRCSRWPAHYSGKKLRQCFSCISQSTVAPGAGELETASTDEMLLLSELEIPAKYLKLIGCSWQDRETAQLFVLCAVDWVLVDSTDGVRVPTLIGQYAESAEERPNEWEWSTVEEIQKWISSNAVNGGLTSREARALRRAAQHDFKKRKDSTQITDEDDHRTDVDETSLLTGLNGGYMLRDVEQRAVLPGGSVSYEVTYVTG